MSVELKYLALTALLTAALWIPYIVCQVMTNGPLSGENYIDPTPRPVPLWGQRASRAHLNAVEAFAPYAALVLIVHVAGKESAAKQAGQEAMALRPGLSIAAYMGGWFICRRDEDKARLRDALAQAGLPP